MQRETSGKFFTYKSYNTPIMMDIDDNNESQLDENDIINKLSLEVCNESSKFKYNVGEVSCVTAVEGENVFHTHPFYNYRINKTLIGPPSSDDLSAFLEFVLNDIQKPMTKIQKFGAVITLEGIYIYSLSAEGIRSLKNGKVLNQDEIKKYNYPINERFYDWDKYEIMAIPTQINEVNDGVNKYLKWFNDVNRNFGNYFKIDFKPWKEFDENTTFQIHYYNGNRRIPYQPINIGVSNNNVNYKYHEPPEIIDERLLKKQRINGGKKRTIKKFYKSV
jgi:hypothetical protein